MAYGIAIARVIGSGDGTGEDPYRPDISTLGRTTYYEPLGTRNWCVVLFKYGEGKYPAFADITGTNLYKIPLTAFNKTVGDVPASKRQEINSKLQARGFDTSWITSNTPIRELLARFIKHIEPDVKLSKIRDALKRMLPD